MASSKPWAVDLKQEASTAGVDSSNLVCCELVDVDDIDRLFFETPPR